MDMSNDRMQSLLEKTFITQLCMVFVLVAAGESLAFQRSVSRTGVNGGTVTRDASVTHTQNGYTRNVTQTGQQGNMRVRTATGQWDPTTNTWVKNVSATGPAGQSGSRTSIVTGTGNGYSKTTTATGPNGNTVTGATTGYWDPVTGTWIKTKNVTTSGVHQ